MIHAVYYDLGSLKSLSLCDSYEVMRIVKEIKEVKKVLNEKRLEGKIGLVPTMGALHQGHLSLVDECIKNNDFSVVSVFVNPTQFNDKTDLERYPRDLKKDCEMLLAVGCNLVFAPEVEDIYPEPDTRKFEFGTLESVMEGKHRPGHFNGVGQIVSKLFEIIEPSRAYFGMKDFQQLAVIKKLVKDYLYPVEIIPCPIVREKDGLAMSSRNLLLDKEKRKAAPFIYKILKEVTMLSTNKSPQELKKMVAEAFNESEELELEYFDIVDDITLQSVSELSEDRPSTACIAVHAGKIRLIDNVQINT